MVNQNLRSLVVAWTIWVCFTLCQQSKHKSQNSGCVFLLEALVNWLTKFKVGISKSRSAPYIISACNIKEKTVIVFNGDFRCRLTKIIWPNYRVPTYCVSPFFFYLRRTLSTPYHANNKANNCNSKDIIELWVYRCLLAWSFCPLEKRRGPWWTHKP